MHVVKLTFSLVAIEEAISKLAAEALNRQLAARMADDDAEEQEWERRYQQYVAAHAQLRRLIRCLMRILVAVLSSIRSSLLRRLNSSRRQSANDPFVDGMVASIPVPPTRMLVCGIN